MKKILAIGIVAMLVLGGGLVAASVSDKIDTSDNEASNNEVNLSSMNKTISLSEPGVLTYEIDVGDLTFNEDWERPAYAKLDDKILTGCPSEGRWIKPYVNIEFRDTNGDSGKVEWKLWDDNNHEDYYYKNDGWWDQSFTDILEIEFKVYPGHTYDLHGKVWNAEDYSTSHCTLYVV